MKNTNTNTSKVVKVNGLSLRDYLEAEDRVGLYNVQPKGKRKYSNFVMTCLNARSGNK